MTDEKIEEIIEKYPDVQFMDGYNDCVIGICRRCGMDDVVLYDQEKVIQKLISDGMNREEAFDFFEYNQVGAWIGNSTPAFAELMND